MLITETWINNKIFDGAINLPGYILFRKNRETVGGGVCIFIKNIIAGHKIYATVRQQFGTTSPIEPIWLYLVVNKVKCLLGCVYRSKRTTTVVDNQNLIRILEGVMSLTEPPYIFVDFSYP